MRATFLILALLFLTAGLLFGALNSAPLTVELYFTRFELSAGVGLLSAALLGALLGGLVVLTTVAWPLRRALVRLRRESGSSDAGTA